ncbi:unnamed protein product, partial [Prorocentrum cordatum]
GRGGAGRPGLEDGGGPGALPHRAGGEVRARRGERGLRPRARRQEAPERGRVRAAPVRREAGRRAAGARSQSERWSATSTTVSAEDIEWLFRVGLPRPGPDRVRPGSVAENGGGLQGLAYQELDDTDLSGVDTCDSHTPRGYFSDNATERSGPPVWDKLYQSAAERRARLANLKAMALEDSSMLRPSTNCTGDPTTRTPSSGCT